VGFRGLRHSLLNGSKINGAPPRSSIPRAVATPPRVVLAQATSAYKRMSGEQAVKPVVAKSAAGQFEFSQVDRKMTASLKFDHDAGLMFWFRWNRLSGSYCFLISARRS
jgi:hypothetical protein